jgi:hypothetical protein
MLKPEAPDRFDSQAAPLQHGRFWLFFPMQLLREVVGNAHFLDGMKLSVQEVRVPFFVFEHALK